jgi:hypothetical protein
MRDRGRDCRYNAIAMSRPIRHLLLFVLALAAGTAVLCWGDQVAPLRAAEAEFARLTVAAAVTPPFLCEPPATPGGALRVRKLTRPTESVSQLQFLAIGDDPLRVFEQSPPSAGDFAVILAQLQRQQHRQVALALPLAWDDPDPIALAALDQQLGSFSLAITASPLVRGVSPKPIPPAFLRASLPMAQVTGDSRVLPLVNRTAHASVLLGSTATLAGFTLLESEDAPDFAPQHATPGPPLLARWDDRVVLAVPLLVAMAHAGVTPEQLHIELGRHIRVGADGPLVPIDEFGRLAVGAAPGRPAFPATPAEALIEALIASDEPAAALAPTDPPIILRDDRTGLAEPQRRLAAGLGNLINQIEASPRPGAAIDFQHPPRWLEVAMLVPLALLSSWFLRLGRSSRLIAVLLTAVLTTILHLVIGQQLQLATSGLPAAAVLLTGLLAGRRRSTARSTPGKLATTLTT